MVHHIKCSSKCQQDEYIQNELAIASRNQLALKVVKSQQLNTGNTVMTGNSYQDDSIHQYTDRLCC